MRDRRRVHRTCRKPLFPNDVASWAKCDYLLAHPDPEDVSSLFSVKLAKSEANRILLAEREKRLLDYQYQVPKKKDDAIGDHLGASLPKSDEHRLTTRRVYQAGPALDNTWATFFLGGGKPCFGEFQQIKKPRTHFWGLLYLIPKIDEDYWASLGYTHYVDVQVDAKLLSIFEVYMSTNGLVVCDYHPDIAKVTFRPKLHAKGTCYQHVKDAYADIWFDYFGMLLIDAPELTSAKINTFHLTYLVAAQALCLAHLRDLRGGSAVFKPLPRPAILPNAGGPPRLASSRQGQ